MIKVKDGYAKLVGATASGSASHILLSNGGVKAVSDFAAASALDNYLPLIGGVLSGHLSLGTPSTTALLLLSVERNSNKLSVLISGANEGWLTHKYNSGKSTALIQNETRGLIFKDTSDNYFDIWHSGNLKNLSDLNNDLYWANIKVQSSEDKTTIPTFGGLNTTGVIQSSSNYPAYLTSIGTGVYNKTVIMHSTDGLIIERARKTESSSGDIIPLTISQRGGGNAVIFKNNDVLVSGRVESTENYVWESGTKYRITTYEYLGIGRIYNYNEATSTYGTLYIGRNSSDSIIVKPNGYVGIARDPAYVLDVQSNARVASICLEINDEINRYGGNLYLQHRGNIAGSLNDSRTGNIQMVYNGGAVNIGNVISQEILNIGGNTLVNGSIRFKCDSPANIGTLYSDTDINMYNYIHIDKAGGGIRYVSGSWTSGDHIAHSFSTDQDVTRMVIMNATGNVGIGTTDPKYKLHVNGNIHLVEGFSLKLRNHESYYAGLGYDTAGNECISLWAKNTVTRLRWHAGTDFSSGLYNKMMSITPDFEVSKADGTAKGYIGGSIIWTSGNDGSGSSLDADLLDGKHASSFQLAGNYLIDHGMSTSRPDGRTFTLPGGVNGVSMRSKAPSGADIGIFQLTDDNAFICNSSDVGYLFATFDTDQTEDFSSSSNAAFAVLSNHAGVSMKGNLTVASSVYLNNSTSNRITGLHLDSGFEELTHLNKHGYISIGPFNTGHAHIYTDRPNFYFNAPILVNGTTVSLNGHTHSYLPLSGGWMDWNAGIHFKGYNGSTSVFGRMGYATSASGQTMHCINTTGNLANGALYITSNGSTSANDTGGLAIDNEGVTVFGAGDTGSNFTGVFRVLNEDNVADGPLFIVTKASGATVKYNMYAAHFYENSDIRYKTIINNLAIKANQLANLPLFDFKWLDNEDLLNTGTSAQAVQELLPYIVSGTDKLTLDYGVLGTIAGITACKELTEQEKEINKLKEQIKFLKDEINNLKTNKLWQS